MYRSHTYYHAQNQQQAPNGQRSQNEPQRVYVCKMQSAPLVGDGSFNSNNLLYTRNQGYHWSYARSYSIAMIDYQHYWNEARLLKHDMAMGWPGWQKRNSSKTKNTTKFSSTNVKTRTCQDRNADSGNLFDREQKCVYRNGNLATTRSIDGVKSTRQV